MLAPPQLPRNLEASFRDLDSTKPEIRASAINDLLRHARGDDAVRARAIPLLEMRLSDVTPKVRAAAAVGLADLVAKDTVPSLLRGVDDDDAYVRQMVLNALGELGDERALPRLRRALTDKRPEMRYQAIIAFARIADDAKELGQALLAATNDDDDDAVVHIALRIAEERIDAGKRSNERLLTRGARAARGRLHAHQGRRRDSCSARRARRLVMRCSSAWSAATRSPASRPRRKTSARRWSWSASSVSRRRVLTSSGGAWGLMHFVRDTCVFHAKIALASHGSSAAPSRRSWPTWASPRARRARRRGGLRGARARLKRGPCRHRGAPRADAVDPELVKEALGALGRRVTVPQALLDLRYRGGGHVESWFLKANEPGGRRALWLKNTVFARAKGERGEALVPPMAEAWAIAFESRARSRRDEVFGAARVARGSRGARSTSEVDGLRAVARSRPRRALGRHAEHHVGFSRWAPSAPRRSCTSRARRSTRVAFPR